MPGTSSTIGYHKARTNNSSKDNRWGDIVIKRNHGRMTSIKNLLAENPGRVFNTYDVQQALSYADNEHTAIITALNRLAITGDILRVAKGKFVYNNSATPAVVQEPFSTMYEYLGTLNDGSVIMRDENGGLER